MEQTEISRGNWKVISTRNTPQSVWTSRLYVNGGETATHFCAKHKSDAGRLAWASRVLDMNDGPARVYFECAQV